MEDIALKALQVAEEKIRDFYEDKQKGHIIKLNNVLKQFDAIKKS